jgi:HPt (histidine-containing phosphotransfer) domain-containing protein
MSDFLPKPFTQKNLAKTIQQWKPRVARQEALAEDAAVFDPTLLEQLRAEQAVALLERLIGLFQQQSKLDIEGIISAAKQSDWQQLRDNSHTLKSASAQLGFKRLALLLQQIEVAASQGEIDSAAVADIPEAYTEACRYLQAYLNP